MPNRQNLFFLKTPPAVLFITVSALYWLADAALDAFLLSQDSSLAEMLFSPRHEMIMRSSVVILIAVFCFYLNYLTNRFKQTAELLQDKEKQCKDLVESSRDMVQSLRPDGSIVYVNPAWKETLGYSDEEISSLNIFQIIHPDQHEHCHKILKQLITIGQSSSLETVFVTKDGKEIQVEGNVSCKMQHGMPISCMGFFRDITKRKKLADKLDVLSVTDELTGALNRSASLTLADKQLSIAERSGKELALLYADIDGMRIINETLGYSLGDLALNDTANLLHKTFRRSDIIGRIGNNEFIILLTGKSDRAEKNIVFNRLKENLNKLNEEAGRTFELKINLGMAYYDPMDPCSLDNLIKKASAEIRETSN